MLFALVAQGPVTVYEPDTMLRRSDESLAAIASWFPLKVPLRERFPFAAEPRTNTVVMPTPKA